MTVDLEIMVFWLARPRAELIWLPQSCTAVMIAFDPGDTLVYDRGTEALLEGVHARAPAG